MLVLFYLLTTLISSRLLNAALQFPTEEDIVKDGNFGGIIPTHYSLSLRFHAIYGPKLPARVDHYHGTVHMSFRVTGKGRRIIYVHNDGPKIYKSMLYTKDAESILVSLGPQLGDVQSIKVPKKLRPGKSYTLELGFNGSLRSDRGPYYSYDPEPVASGGTWAISTMFQMRGARTAFPCIDHPLMKATFEVCISKARPSNTSKPDPVIFNTPTNRIFNGPNFDMYCFEKTPRMSTYVLSFAVLHGYKFKRVVSNAGIPIRFWYPPKVVNGSISWLCNSTKVVLDKISKYVTVTYPLPMLQILLHQSLPQSIFGIENFGLISLSAFHYFGQPTHISKRILVHEILHQWIGDTATIKSWNEICFQEGLTTYLDYKFSAELLDADFEVSIRQARSLGFLREERSNVPHLLTGKFKDYEDIVFRCFDKAPVIFSTIAESTTPQKFHQYLKALIETYKFGNFAEIDWYNTLELVTSSQYANTLESYYNKPGYPVLIVNALRSAKILEVHISQNHTIAGDVVAPGIMVPVLPVRFAISTGIQEVKTLDSFPTTIGFGLSSNTSWIVLDSTNYYYRVLYNIEAYERLVHCKEALPSLKCPTSTLLGTILDDIDWGISRRVLPLEGKRYLKTLRKLYASLQVPS